MIINNLESSANNLGEVQIDLMKILKLYLHYTGITLIHGFNKVRERRLGKLTFFPN